MPFKKGNIPWNKGKTGVYSEETLERMSKVKKDKYKGKDNPFYGKHHTPEIKRKMSIMGKGKNKGNKNALGHRLSKKARKEISDRMKGDKNPNWKGGRYTRNDGYRFIKKPYHPRAIGKYVLEHILIAEEILGRPLREEEIIHHINGDKSDNKKENLFVCKNQSEHMKLEGQLKRIAFNLVKKDIIKFNKEKGEYISN